jgi:hypothetical protein
MEDINIFEFQRWFHMLTNSNVVRIHIDSLSADEEIQVSYVQQIKSTLFLLEV